MIVGLHALPTWSPSAALVVWVVILRGRPAAIVALHVTLRSGICSTSIVVAILVVIASVVTVVSCSESVTKINVNVMKFCVTHRRSSYCVYYIPLRV